MWELLRITQAIPEAALVLVDFPCNAIQIKRCPLLQMFMLNLVKVRTFLTNSPLLQIIHNLYWQTLEPQHHFQISQRCCEWRLVEQFINSFTD